MLSKGAESGKRDNIRVKYREEHLDKQQKIGPHSKVTREAKKKTRNQFIHMPEVLLEISIRYHSNLYPNWFIPKELTVALPQRSTMVYMMVL